jgi:hypothetical protein
MSPKPLLSGVSMVPGAQEAQYLEDRTRELLTTARSDLIAAQVRLSRKIHATKHIILSGGKLTMACTSVISYNTALSACLSYSNLQQSTPP